MEQLFVTYNEHVGNEENGRSEPIMKNERVLMLHLWRKSTAEYRGWVPIYFKKNKNKNILSAADSSTTFLSEGQGFVPWTRIWRHVAKGCHHNESRETHFILVQAGRNIIIEGLIDFLHD